jgi:hypothetical protein
MFIFIKQKTIILFILLSIFFILSCNSNLNNAHTSFFLGNSILTDDGYVVFCTLDGNIGIMNLLINTPLFTHKIDCYNIVGLYKVPDTNKLLLVSNKSNPRKSVEGIYYRELLMVDMNTISVENRYKVSPGPGCIFCCVTPTLYAQISFNDANMPSGSAHLSIFRMENNEFREISDYSPNPPESSISDVRRIDDHTLLLHAGYRDETSISLEKSVNELIVYNIATNSIIAKSSTKVDALSNPFGLSVSSNGKYAVVHSLHRMELRQIPSQNVIKETPTDIPTYLATVSNDGRYVAFGDSRLAVWDTTTNQIAVLDKLKSNYVDSKDISLPKDIQNSPLTTLEAYRQLCLASIVYNDQKNELYVVTHDGIFTIWDLPKHKLLMRSEVSKVSYIGNNIK